MSADGRIRALGVDPGLTRCGLGIVDGVGRRSVQPVAVDCVRTSPDLDISRRLLTVADAVEVAIDEYHPDVIAIERVFAQKNHMTVSGTTMAAGVVATIGARNNLPVYFYTPSEVKAAVSGNGTANKEQVTNMVVRILGLVAAPRPADAADALAIAICHLWRSPLRDQLQALRQGSNRRDSLGSKTTENNPPEMRRRRQVL